MRCSANTKSGYMRQRVLHLLNSRYMSGDSPVAQMSYLSVTDTVMPPDSKNMPLALHTEGRRCYFCQYN